MSYDLIFRPRHDALNPVTFRAYFEERPRYTILLGKGYVEAAYQNEETGVYFSFAWPAGDAPNFNVNYFRPHTFGLESEPEVTAFVTEFDPQIDDPQAEGMGQGRYSPEGYLRGWNAGNAFAHRAMKGEVTPRHRLPSATLERMWRWNYHRVATQDVFSSIEMEPWFLPRIMLVDGAASVRSIVAWGPDVMILIPDVDGVLVPGPAGPKYIALPDLAPVLARYERVEASRKVSRGGLSWALGIASIGVDWKGSTPPELSRALTALGRPMDGKLVAWDQVLTEEVLAGA